MRDNGVDDMEALRQSIVREARSYIGTPYHKNARIKGVGVDCATFVFCVYRTIGLVPPEEEGIFSDPSIVPISQDWFRHTKEEKYMRQILRHAHKVAEGISYPTLDAKPGTIVITRAVGSKVVNHGGIVVKWPMIVHAVDPEVEETNASTNPLWAFQEVTVLDPVAKVESERTGRGKREGEGEKGDTLHVQREISGAD